MAMTVSSKHEPETAPVKKVFGHKDTIAWCLVTGGIFLAFFLVDPTQGDNYLKVATVSSMLSGTAIVSTVRFFIDYQRRSENYTERYLMWQDEQFEKKHYRAALETMHKAKARDALVIDRLWSTISEAQREELLNEGGAFYHALMNVHNPLHSSPNYPDGWKSEPSEWEDDTE